MKPDLKYLKSSVNFLKPWKSDVKFLKSGMKTLKYDMKFLKSGLRFMKPDLKSLKSLRPELNNALKSGLKPFELFTSFKSVKSLKFPESVLKSLN